MTISSRITPEMLDAITRNARTNVVIDAIRDERVRQDAKWGEQNHPDGTRDDEASRQVRDHTRRLCESAAKRGALTWADILAEESMEAFAEEDPDKLRTELVQIAAVAVAWIECIDRRRSVK